MGGSNSYDPANPQSPADSDNSEPANLRVDNLLPPDQLVEDRLKRRKAYWEMLQAKYGAASRAGAAATHDTVYRRAMQLAESPLSSAFDLSKERDETRRAYGNSPFVRVSDGSAIDRARCTGGRGIAQRSWTARWDSHLDNFKIVQSLSEQLDLGWSQLMIELEERGLLESTTIVWMGEFGRTPEINERGGRDHFPDAWSTVLAAEVLPVARSSARPATAVKK